MKGVANKADYPELEEVLYEWVKSQREAGFSVSTDMLIEKGNIIFREIYVKPDDVAIEDWGDLSIGWASRFKERYDIKKKKLVGGEPLCRYLWRLELRYQLQEKIHGGGRL